ncbi:MAG TPA: helix-turn-helix transcriptional regulator [Polyangiaceae bacterium]
MPPSSRTRHHRETTAFQCEVEAFGRLVRSLRRNRQWTIEQAAERFGVEPAYVRSIERGGTNPSLAVIVSVATAFEMRPRDLLIGEPPTPTRSSKARR